MTWLLSIVLALLTGALGLFVAGAIMSLCVSWYHISSFEGGSGYAVVFTALLGGVAGLIIGLVTARLVAAGAAPGFLKSLGYAFGLVVALGGITTAISWSLAHIPPTIDGAELDLEVEVMLPVGVTQSPATGTGESFLNLACVINHKQISEEHGELRAAEARQENGRWIVPGKVRVFTMRGQRALDIQLNGEKVPGFLVPLPARPGKSYKNWSNWGPRPPAGYPAWPDSKPSYRFRVHPEVPPAPVPDAVELEAKAFAALSPAAPLPEWLAYLGDFPPSEKLKPIMAVVAQRPTELAAAIRSSEPAPEADPARKTLRELGLIAVTNLRDVAPEVIAAVREDGLALTEDLRKLNAQRDTDENFHYTADALKVRFFWWERAWRHVHEAAKVDTRPLIQTVFELASVHADEPAIEGIRNQARYHLDDTAQADTHAHAGK